MESEITVAFRRLVLESPTIGFLVGHGERNIYKEGDREFKRFSSDKDYRGAMINQGFDIKEVYARQPIGDDIDILVISELRSSLSEEEKRNLDAYIARGGDLLILGGPERQELMNSIVKPFGVRFLPGRLVQPTRDLQADLIQALPTDEGINLFPGLNMIRVYEGCVVFPGCVGLEYTPVEGMRYTSLLETDSVGCWNEMGTTDFVNDTVVYNPECGDKDGVFTSTLAVSREVNGKEQRVVVIGNTDCFSNGELATGRREVRNFANVLVRSSFYWLSHEKLPIHASREKPIDRKLYISEPAMEVWKIVFMVIAPVILALAGIVIWLRRKGR